MQVQVERAMGLQSDGVAGSASTVIGVRAAGVRVFIGGSRIE